MATYTWIDFLIMIIFFFSILVGLGRGFLRETIAIVTIIAAFFVAITFSQPLANWLNGTVGAQSFMQSIANFGGGADVSGPVSFVTVGISFFALFLLTMVIGGMFGRIATNINALPGLGFIDRVLGGFFGAIRAYLMVVFILFLFQFTAIPQTPAWASSRYEPKFQPSVIWLANVVGPGLALVKDQINKL